ncbi:MAG: Rieske 2Fe-2S domain-containing protein [Candidatus Caldarchaeum sp.]
MAGARRSLLRTIFGASLLATLAPFLSWGGFLFRPEARGERLRQRIINLKDFPVNSKYTFPFPATGDTMVDSDPFRQYILVHLPSGDLRAYSKVCIHLWCLYDYIPEKREFQCPCHGSVYNADVGVAVRGPAAFQPYPTNTLPELILEVDGDGTVYAVGLKGRVGYGREYRAEMAWLQQRQSTSPNTPVSAYAPFKDVQTPEQALAIIQRNDLRLVKWYGYVDKSPREREWLTGETVNDISEATGVYAVDVSSTPDRLLKLAEHPQIITLMPRQ